jgi:peptidoglycan biosynthesis protein MviN/MurJ (putative lipid II flippase)
VWATSRIALVAAVGTLVLDLALIPTIGVMGAAVASSVAYAAAAVLLYGAARELDPEGERR